MYASSNPDVEVKEYTYDLWMESVGIPIHRGYHIEDLRTVELGWWEERQCNAAFIQLMGQEGITSAMVMEIPAGKTLPPVRFALDEVIYVLEGRGMTTIWAADGAPKKTFEWQDRSLFQIPHNYFQQLGNMRGDKPARVLRYSYLALAMSLVAEPRFYFDNPFQAEDHLGRGGDLYSEAKLVTDGNPAHVWGGRSAYWLGNFFPDMQAWNIFSPNVKGGSSVYIMFPDSEMSCHMSVFPNRTYKKAGRHGPGRALVITGGEGYSVLWEEGKEKIVAPWHEGSMFVPPNRWFHQHFNVGATPARYLALQPPRQFRGHAEKIEDRAKDEIEYCDEDPWIRRKFEEELGKRGITSLMPEEAYKVKTFDWHPRKSG
ncbi:MAG: cupin domain-containing protein [Deltaproteobacteria bacterium]|nr:cupin domain-containing protein [Deltaproteobacteria bacterium]